MVWLSWNEEKQSIERRWRGEANMYVYAVRTQKTVQRDQLTMIHFRPVTSPTKIGL